MFLDSKNVLPGFAGIGKDKYLHSAIKMVMKLNSLKFQDGIQINSLYSQ